MRPGMRPNGCAAARHRWRVAPALVLFPVPGTALAPVHRPPSSGHAGPPSRREALATLRKELNGLVTAWHHRTGQPHGAIHAQLRSTCGGPPLAQATADQIRERIAALRRWAAAAPLTTGRPKAGQVEQRRRVHPRARASSAPCGAQFGERFLARAGCDARDQAGQHARSQAFAHRVGHRRADAVVGGEAGDVDIGDAAFAQPGGEWCATWPGALESRVGGGMRPLAEHGLDPRHIQIRVEGGAWRPGDAVRRPRVQIVRLAGEMGAGIDVVVTGGDHMVVFGGVAVQVGADAAGDLRAAGHRQRAAFAEVVLHVDDDESAHGPTVSRLLPGIQHLCAHLAPGHPRRRAALPADVGGCAPGDPGKLGERRREDGMRMARSRPDDLVPAQPHVDQRR